MPFSLLLTSPEVYSTQHIHGIRFFRYAIVTGRAETNPASELASALTAPKSVHYPHLLADYKAGSSTGAGSVHDLIFLDKATFRICGEEKTDCCDKVIIE